METTIVYWGYNRIMEKKMETTMAGSGCRLQLPCSRSEQLSATAERLTQTPRDTDVCVAGYTQALEVHRLKHRNPHYKD